MTYKIKKQLHKLGEGQFEDDIKKYICSTHEFYGVKLPELRIMAKKLHEEYELKDFYKVFNRLWGSGYHEEMSLAIYGLQLYKDDFDLDTWKFLKPKLKNMRSWDSIDSVGINIVGEIVLKEERVREDILKFGGRDKWMKRMAIVSMIPLVRDGEVDFVMGLIEREFDNGEDCVREGIAKVLREIGRVEPEVAKKFILKNVHEMSEEMFNVATENLKELRKVREIRRIWF